MSMRLIRHLSTGCELRASGYEPHPEGLSGPWLAADSSWLAARQRQRNRKCRPLAHFALQANLSAVQLHEPARQREAEPRAFLLPRVVASDLPEFLENRPLVFRGDADAGVGHRDFDGRCIHVRVYGDAPAVRGELD